MALINNGTVWTGTSNQTESSKTYTFSTQDTYLDKDIKFTVTADVITEVSAVPATKTTSIIYNTATGKYYLWR